MTCCPAACSSQCCSSVYLSATKSFIRLNSFLTPARLVGSLGAVVVRRGWGGVQWEDLGPGWRAVPDSRGRREPRGVRLAPGRAPGGAYQGEDQLRVPAASLALSRGPNRGEGRFGRSRSEPRGGRLVQGRARASCRPGRWPAVRRAWASPRSPCRRRAPPARPRSPPRRVGCVPDLEPGVDAHDDDVPVRPTYSRRLAGMVMRPVLSARSRPSTRSSSAPAYGRRRCGRGPWRPVRCSCSATRSMVRP